MICYRRVIKGLAPFYPQSFGHNTIVLSIAIAIIYCQKSSADLEWARAGASFYEF